MEGASKDAWQTNTPQPSKKDRTYVKIDAFARSTPGAVAVALVRGDGGLEEGCVETVEGSKVLQSEGTVLFGFRADRDHQTTSFLHATPQFLATQTQF